VKNGRPTDLAKELESISKAIALSDKNAPIKFLPIDRINTIIAVAPNPGAFKEVEQWMEKLDVPIKAAAGGIQDHVYRVRYGDATSMACSIQALYGQLSGYGGYGGGQSSIQACMGPTGTGGNGFGNTYGGGGFGSSGSGGGGFGGGQGNGGYGAGGFGGGQYGGMNNGGGYGYNPYAAGGGGSPFSNAAAAPAPGVTGTPGTPGAGDLTGTYLGIVPGGGFGGRGPRVIANPMNNTLLVQATAQEYESILQLIKELDIPPRQVLIEAKIYSIDLSHTFSSDVTAALTSLAGTTGSTVVTNTAASLLGSLTGGGVNLSASTLVGKSRVLSGIVSLMESESNAKIISSPSIIATDSIAASINVGTTVPTEAGSTASGITGSVTTGVSNVSTGIGLNILARVTPSGIVTMVISQNISDPQATDPTLTNIQSPSFATKSISTQVTVQDGDTIAIGGQIQESTTSTLSGIPVLDRIPVIGAFFGSRSYSKERTELIMFLTPHVIYDSNQLLDASDELKGQIKALRKDIKE
jgi:general secretion pathway protein D